MLCRCEHCAQEFPLTEDGRLPPWCPRCGTDLNSQCVSAAGLAPVRGGPETRVPTVPWRQEPQPAQRLPDEPWDERSCFACGTPLALPEVPDCLVAYCPECGQCLKAPKPWTPDPVAAAVIGPCLPSNRNRTKMPGGVGVFMGVCAIGLGWLIPGIPMFLGGAAILIGCALLFEGLGRIRAEARKQQLNRPAPTLDLELAADGAPELLSLGSLQSVFASPNSWSDSLAILCFGLAFGSGGLFLLDWLSGGLVISVKLIAAAVMCPPIAVYLVYRAVRNLGDHHRVLLFDHGLVHIRGVRVEVYPWDRIAGLHHEAIGDAIDEHAVEIRLRYGLPPLRFTCVHFPNLDRLLVRLQRAFTREAVAAES